MVQKKCARAQEFLKFERLLEGSKRGFESRFEPKKFSVESRPLKSTEMTCGQDEPQTQNPNKRTADSRLCATADLAVKKAKIEVNLASSEAGQLNQIESEFQILKSLIPDIANRKQINEVRKILILKKL